MTGGENGRSVKEDKKTGITKNNLIFYLAFFL